MRILNTFSDKVNWFWEKTKDLIKSVDEIPAKSFYTFVRVSIAVTLLYFCVYALRFVGQAPQAFSKSEDEGLRVASAIQLDEESSNLLTTPLASPQFTLSGQTEPNSTVQLLIQGKEMNRTFSDENGHFVLENITLPPWATAIEIEALNSQQVLGPQSIQRQLPGWEETAFSPDISLAIYIPERDSLWVAGIAAPNALVNIETENSDSLVKLVANHLGVFEGFIPIFGTPPEDVTPSLVGGNLPPSNDHPVTISRLKDLPLARVVDVNLHADQIGFNFQITLPVTHPYFQAIVEGTLPVDAFIAYSFGAFTYPLEINDVFSGIGYRPLNLQWDQPLFMIEKQGGTVEVHGVFDQTLDGLGFFELSSGGIGMQPFLTAEDRLTIHYQDFKAKWFGEPYPSETNEQQAIWIGPLELGGDSDILQMKFTPPGEQKAAPGDVATTARPAPAVREVEKLWDFILSFSSRLKGKSSLLYTLWSVGIFSLPFITLFFIRKSKLVSDRSSWKWFVHIAVILGFWRGWYLFFFIADRWPSEWLNRFSTYFLRWGSYLDAKISWEWNIVGVDTFWLIFSVFAVLIPLTFHTRTGTESENNPEPGSQTEKPKIRLVIQLTGAVLMFAAIFQLVQNWQTFFSENYRFSVTAEVLFGIVTMGFVMFFLLFAGGWSGAFFGLTLIAMIVRAAAEMDGLEPFYRFISLWISNTYTYHTQTFDDLILQLVPWTWVQIAAGFFGYFFINQLLKRIFLVPGKWVWVRWLLSAACVTAAIMWTSIPASFMLTIGAILVTLAFSWFAVQAILRLRQNNARLFASHWPVVLVWFVVAVSIAWPVANANESLQFHNLFDLVNILDSRLVHVLFLCLVVLMWNQAQEEKSVFHSGAALSAGGYVFAVLMINNYSTILLIPLAFIIAWWLGKNWVFRPQTEVEAIRSLMGDDSEQTSSVVRAFVNKALYHRRLNGYRNGLRKKLDKGDIEPEKYEKLLSSYRGTLLNEYGLQDQPTTQSQESTYAFAVGFGNIKKNISISVQTGMLLGLIPFGIAVYKYLPTTTMRYPFPLAYIVSFLIWASASWIIYAFFFGYYYPHLRGNTGLSKGLWMALWMTIPQLTIYVASLRQLAEMADYLIFSLQVFIFFSVLGLLIDIRVLLYNRFRSRDIVTVHELPKLAAFGSSILTALAPILSSILTGWLGSNIDKLPGLIEPFKVFWGE